MSKESKPLIDVIGIRKRIPHRFPFLLIDRVEKFEHGPDKKKFLGRKVVATKNVSVNEPYFTGHFPDEPIMPGVLQVEAMAQAGALACVPEDNEKMDVLIAKINGAKFRRKVIPGDVLEIHAEIISEKGTILGLRCEAYSFGELVSEVELMAKIFLK